MANPNIRRLSTRQSDFEAQFKKLRMTHFEQDPEIDATVARILADVRARGDAAVLQYSALYDGVKAQRLSGLEVPRTQLSVALDALDHEQREALEHAAARVRAYHERQLTASWSYAEADGTVLGQQVSALERVGLYVPGGKAAYPSTVLMNALPARVAGVQELIMVAPAPGGVLSQLVLAAAALCEVDRVYTLGGAQAVGALAFGTETITAVDKIVGPGNAYVAAAKRQVFGVVGIDMVAGPSEILVICDGTTAPDWIAMDLFAQAEHDEMAQAVLLCPDAGFIDAVENSLQHLLPEMTRSAVIGAALAGRGALIEVRDVAEAVQLANRIAPEHLELSVESPEKLLAGIKHAGAIFLGRYSSEVLGDYCAGPNHVLPTSGTARFSSPLGVYDFQKRSSVIHVSRAAAATLGKTAACLAYGEGLPAHARSAELRIGKT
ncbi:MAG: histidinol dehydrogenase [Burkholderiales bacterium]